MKPQQTTPITSDPSRALTRILQGLESGYSYHTQGQIAPAKVVHLCEKFHRMFGIGLTPSQRKARRAAGEANAMLVLLQPQNHTVAYWLLMATKPLENQHMGHAIGRRINYCNYEFIQYLAEGNKKRWTVRMEKEWYEELRLALVQCRKEQDWTDMDYLIETISKEPGFHGIRQQKFKLFELARNIGYPKNTPFIPHMTKIHHGDPVALTPLDLKLRPKKTA